MHTRALLACLLLLAPGTTRIDSHSAAQNARPAPGTDNNSFDLVVYGGTAGGAITAVAAAREGLRVALLEPGRHIGGMVSGGLGWTDFGTQGGDRRLLAGVLRTRREEVRPRHRVALRAARRGGDVRRAAEGSRRAGVPRPSTARTHRRREERRPRDRPGHGEWRALHGQDLRRQLLRRRPDGAGASVATRGGARRSASSTNRWPACATRRRSISFARPCRRSPPPASCCPKSCRARRSRSARRTSRCRPITSACA